MGIGFNVIGRKVGEEIKKFVQLIFEARKNDNRRALLYNSAGEDSVPLDDERLILVKIDGTGKYAALAVLTQSQGAKPGEKIFFARDKDGAIKSKLSMLGDGSVEWELDNLLSIIAKNNIELNTDENVDLTATKKTTVKGADVEVSGKVVVTGGSLQCDGTVAPTGKGALCGCTYCYVIGAPVAGELAQGT